MLATVAAVDEALAARRARVRLLRAVPAAVSHDVPRVIAREVAERTPVLLVSGPSSGRRGAAGRGEVCTRNGCTRGGPLPLNDDDGPQGRVGRRPSPAAAALGVAGVAAGLPVAVAVLQLPTHARRG